MLGSALTVLAGAVLPLHHFGAQRVALRPLAGPLQPPHLASLLQQCSPRRQSGGGVVQGPRLVVDGRQLPIAKVAVRQVSVGVRGRGPRLQHYGAAGDVNRHAGVLDEEVLQGAALEAGRPESGPLRQVNNEPAVHFILLRDEGSWAVGVLRRWGGAEEEAGKALEHGGGVKRPRGGAL